MVNGDRRPDALCMLVAEFAPPAATQFSLNEQDERVIFWRAEVLERAGYDDRAVLVLSTHADLDLHLAVDLLAKGCSQETALLILT